MVWLALHVRKWSFLSAPQSLQEFYLKAAIDFRAYAFFTQAQTTVNNKLNNFETCIHTCTLSHTSVYSDMGQAKTFSVRAFRPRSYCLVPFTKGEKNSWNLGLIAENTKTPIVRVTIFEWSQLPVDHLFLSHHPTSPTSLFFVPHYLGQWQVGDPITIAFNGKVKQSTFITDKDDSAYKSRIIIIPLGGCVGNDGQTQSWE